MQSDDTTPPAEGNSESLWPRLVIGLQIRTLEIALRKQQRPKDPGDMSPTERAALVDYINTVMPPRKKGEQRSKHTLYAMAHTPEDAAFLQEGFAATAHDREKAVLRKRLGRRGR